MLFGKLVNFLSKVLLALSDPAICGLGTLLSLSLGAGSFLSVCLDYFLFVKDDDARSPPCTINPVCPTVRLRLKTCRQGPSPMVRGGEEEGEGEEEGRQKRERESPNR